ncbi:hypothetical protein Q0590_35800 [Rhodocytophaga aerolata]|uniref:Uncharacterized protein n=1 Tax=Rhodocytophaga aerolata TaxID=455078 RepID=A0ABT8RK37_9BACT|nr:hypothetical protein [Rhodocytophaga aerolata]MDO1451693.1 hypothetical protein [Rhodocytophaga aerolata]
MDIYVDQFKKAHLPEGKHLVSITSVEEGKTRTNHSYFQCVFENEHGQIQAWFYPTEKGIKAVVRLFTAAGLEVRSGAVLQTERLLGTKLYIWVKKDTFFDKEKGQERTYHMVSRFEPVLDDQGAR